MFLRAKTFPIEADRRHSCPRIGKLPRSPPPAPRYCWNHRPRLPAARRGAGDFCRAAFGLRNRARSSASGIVPLCRPFRPWLAISQSEAIMLRPVGARQSGCHAIDCDRQSAEPFRLHPPESLARDPYSVELIPFVSVTHAPARGWRPVIPDNERLLTRLSPCRDLLFFGPPSS